MQGLQVLSIPTKMSVCWHKFLGANGSQKKMNEQDSNQRKDGKRYVKFKFSKKAKKNYKIFRIVLMLFNVKNKWLILSNFVALSHYINFTIRYLLHSYDSQSHETEGCHRQLECWDNYWKQNIHKNILVINGFKQHKVYIILVPSLISITLLILILAQKN